MPRDPLPDRLYCPGCGEETLHHFQVVVYDRLEDDPTVTVTAVSGAFVHTSVESSADSPNPSSRRDGILVRFWCECCDCKPVLRLDQHKGTTFIAWGPQTPHEEALPVPPQSGRYNA